MSYHLNIVFEEERSRGFTLEKIISILNNIDPNFEVLETDNSIKSFKVKDIKNLHFSNGKFWSIYKNDEELQNLITCFKSSGLILVGEEGETYPVSNFVHNQEYNSNLISFLRQNLVSIFIISLFLILALFIG